ncbi:MAG TPA: hypothetical protein VGE63_00440 [Candidatus Paceibacterota bacterium]
MTTKALLTVLGIIAALVVIYFVFFGKSKNADVMVPEDTTTEVENMPVTTTPTPTTTTPRQTTPTPRTTTPTATPAPEETPSFPMTGFESDK